MKERDQDESIGKNDTGESENVIHGIEKNFKKLDFLLERFEKILHHNTRKSCCEKGTVKR